VRIVGYRSGLMSLACVLVACSAARPANMAARLTTLSCSSAVSGRAAKRPPGIYGTLRMVGGVNLGVNHPVAGTVTITSATGSRCDLPVVAGGSFEVTLPVGRYTVTGHSPDFGDGKYECSGGAVSVTSAGESAVTVACPVR
jgi:hypothetical protein